MPAFGTHGTTDTILTCRLKIMGLLKYRSNDDRIINRSITHRSLMKIDRQSMLSAVRRDSLSPFGKHGRTISKPDDDQYDNNNQNENFLYYFFRKHFFF